MTSLLSPSFGRFRDAVEEARRLARSGKTVNILRSRARGCYVLCPPEEMAGKLRDYEAILRVVSVGTVRKNGNVLFREPENRYDHGRKGEKTCSP